MLAGMTLHCNLGPPGGPNPLLAAPFPSTEKFPIAASNRNFPDFFRVRVRYTVIVPCPIVCSILYWTGNINKRSLQCAFLWQNITILHQKLVGKE